MALQMNNLLRIVQGQPDCLGNISTWHIMDGVGQTARRVTTYAGDIYEPGSVEKAHRQAEEHVRETNESRRRTLAQFYPELLDN